MIGKPKPTKQPKGKKRRPKSGRKVLERKLHDVMLDLVRWRDGGCVLRHIDGGRCRGVLQGGHVIPVARASHMRYDIDNLFCQCAGHNFLHFHGDPIYFDWYVQTWGADAFHALTMRELQRTKATEADLLEWLDGYLRKWEERPTLYDETTLERLGYFGGLSFGYSSELVKTNERS